MFAEGVDERVLLLADVMDPDAVESHAGQFGELVVVVCDTGIGITPRPDSPGLGLGMPLMASVTNSFRVVSADRGTEIHMAFALPGAA